jgi:hypothetical protein
MQYLLLLVLALVVLYFMWPMLPKMREGFKKCNAEVGPRTLQAMLLGAEGAPSCV